MSIAVTSGFAALGDPVRATMVDALARADATVSELASLFEISIQAVSKHLDVLERAGVIRRTRVGRTRVVSLEVGAVDDMTEWMEARRRLLEARYRRLDGLLADLMEEQS